MINTQIQLQFVRRWTSTIREELDMLDVQLAKGDAASAQAMLEASVMIHTLSSRAVKLLADLATGIQTKNANLNIDARGQNDPGAVASAVHASPRQN